MRLQGKSAIITGAGGDLGRGTALRLAEEGARVMVNDINLERAEETVALIDKAGGDAVAGGRRPRQLPAPEPGRYRARLQGARSGAEPSAVRRK